MNLRSVRGLLTAVTVALVLVIAAQPAAARDLPAGGLTREQVSSWLTGQGLTPNPRTDSNGASIVSSAVNGVNFDIYFFDCDSDRCRSIQFAAGWTNNGATGERVNEWNRDHRFIRAYLDRQGNPFGEYDLVISPGGTWEEIDHAMDNWKSMIVDFKTFIGA
jgi:hypothetical protein